MDPSRILQARKYFDLKLEGNEEAAVEVYDGNLLAVQDTPEFLAVKNAVIKAQKEQLQQEVSNLQAKKVRAYANLLDKGEELMEEATTMSEKAAAQANQRANLGVGVIEDAMSWNGEDRNQIDDSDILEGIVL